MKKKNILFLLSFLIIPSIVLASGGDDGVPLMVALFMEAFVSIHMSLFVLKPLSEIIKPEDSKNFFWKLFAIRAVILLVFDFFVTPNIAILDFLAVFVGAFIIVPISIGKTGRNINVKSVISDNSSVKIYTSNNNDQVVVLNCAKCGSEMNVTDKFCPNCGEPFAGDNVVVGTKARVAAKAADFDPIYNFSEDQLLEQFIRRKMQTVGMEDNYRYYIPEKILKRKKILNLIFSVLLFVYIVLIFFHFPLATYVIGLIILVVFFIVSRRYDFMDYIKKEIKSRPSEKITNILMNAKNSLVTDNSIIMRVITILCAIILPLVLFINPRIMYEKVEGGYAVRFYAFGLTNFKTATIPETYKNEKVVSLRGNTFSNMPFLTKVTLPDTITEIRGQAFKNDIKLTSVNIPTNLQYLGGGAFYNCKSIEEVILPDSLTYLGGESFYGASALKSVKLSDNLTEIRGDSFEYCTSLTDIKIPDKVTRIGGHAFYGDSSLAEVSISENSELQEIGSSAFRQCYSLNEITIPASTFVNERAFKESPTVVKKYGETDEYNYEDEDLYNSIAIDDSYEQVQYGTSTFYLSDKKYFNRYNMYLSFSKLENGNATFVLTYKNKTEDLVFPLKFEEIFYYAVDDYIISLSNNGSNSVYVSVNKAYNGVKDYKYHVSLSSNIKKVVRLKSNNLNNGEYITINGIKNMDNKNVLDITLGGTNTFNAVLTEVNKDYIYSSYKLKLYRISSNNFGLDIYFN